MSAKLGPAVAGGGRCGADAAKLTDVECSAVRLLNLHVPVTRPQAFRLRWSGWRRYRQASARKSHYARRLRDHESLL